MRPLVRRSPPMNLPHQFVIHLNNDVFSRLSETCTVQSSDNEKADDTLRQIFAPFMNLLNQSDKRKRVLSLKIASCDRINSPSVTPSSGYLSLHWIKV